jgi:pimeloyl-ACP methyl ester carboxylesterase
VVEGGCGADARARGRDVGARGRGAGEAPGAGGHGRGAGAAPGIGGHSRAARRPGPRAPLAYERCGEGEPLVLLHPLGADRAVWRPVVPYLKAYRDVIALDLPGFGGSAPLTGSRPPTPARLAITVVRMLEWLGLEPRAAHLAGNSLGGWVALEAAVAGRAASVTAIAPAGLWPRALSPKPQVARSLARAALPVAPALMRAATLRWLALAGTVAHPARVPAEQAASLIRSYALAPGFVAVNRAMRAGRFERLAEIEVPVTLIWPERDRLIARPATVSPNVREHVLPSCGHVPMWDDPEAVAELLLAGSAPGADGEPRARPLAGPGRSADRAAHEAGQLGDDWAAHEAERLRGD